MVIDTSAILAILLAEPSADRLVRAIAAAPERLLPAPAAVESAAVLLARKGPSGPIVLDALLQRLGVEVVPMDAAAAGHARAACQRFGRGVGNPAVLNFGDCLSYGVARALGDTLLFTGADFAGTDVEPAPY